MRRKLTDEATSIKISHASAARDEMKVIANEFRELARQSGIATAAIDQLETYLNDTTQRADVINEPHAGAARQRTREVEKAT